MLDGRSLFSVFANLENYYPIQQWLARTMIRDANMKLYYWDAFTFKEVHYGFAVNHPAPKLLMLNPQICQSTINVCLTKRSPVYGDLLSSLRGVNLKNSFMQSLQGLKFIVIFETSQLVYSSLSLNASKNVWYNLMYRMEQMPEW